MGEVLTSILGGAAKALATKAITSPAEALARKTLKQVDGQPVDAATMAVSKAVEAARKDLIDHYWAGEDALSRDVVTKLEHPPFAEALVKKLLFRGQPDFDRLRRSYLNYQPGKNPSEDAKRWQALQEPLELFFDVLEQHLEADPLLGPLLRDSRRLAVLSRLKDGQSVIVEVSREIQRFQKLTARATEAGNDQRADLVTLLQGNNATLGQIHELLSEQLSRLAPAESTTDAPGKSAESLLPSEERYLRLLRKECNRLPLADDSRDVSTKQDERPELANVYIDLETTDRRLPTQVLFSRLGGQADDWPQFLEALSRWEGRLRAREKSAAGAPPVEVLEKGMFLVPHDEELSEDHPMLPWIESEETLAAARNPLTALEAVIEKPYMVLLGDPGSGKSTFVNHLAATLACRLLGDAADPLESPSGPLGESWFPVRIILRRWSASLKAEKIEEGHELKLLYQALPDLPGEVPHDQWLKRFDSEKTLVLFDGLDEVPAGSDDEINRREIIVAAVEAFRAAHPKCRVLVTCRVKPYREGSSRLSGCPIYRLAPLDDDRVRRFCERWYDELARVGRLSDAEADDRRERLLAALKVRPVLREMSGTPLLLTMLARVNARSRLPEGRAELYSECVDQLLWEWERQKRGGVDSLVSLLERPGIEKPGAALTRADFERVLWELTWNAHAKSGKDETVDLPFADLRQALAKIHPERDPGWAWANGVLELMRERGGLLVESQPGVFTFPHRSFQEYLACRWLLERGDAPSTAGRLAANDAWGEVILLSCGYLAYQGRFGDLQAIVTELVAGQEPQEPQEWLRVLLAGRAWVEFGPHRAQGRTGGELTSKVPGLLTQLMQHPDLPPQQRLEAGLLAADLGDLPEDLDDWVEIPADTLDYSFKIGRYPVTNAQFHRFGAAGGYDRDKGWFSEEAQRLIIGWEGGQWPSGPRYQNRSRLMYSTLPVTCVCWYGAQAYAAWLTERLRKKAAIREDEAVRLATVAEWQRACGGADGRTYSWGTEFDARRVNSEENSLHGSTPVHMYPTGVTPEGALDLTGNVWEWTTERRDRIATIAGGAYNRDADGVGLTARNRLDALDWGINVGFRVVVVPISRADSDS